MEFFFRKRDERRSEEGLPLLQINMSGKRAYDKYIERDTAITLWLKPSTKERINEVCTYIDTSTSDFLRQVIFIHLYGRIDFLGLLQTKHPTALNSHLDTGIVPDTTPQVEREVKAVKKEAVKGPERNTASVKVWLPALMKADLEKLAERNDSPVSDYARTVIESHLFGHLTRRKLKKRK